MSETESKTKSEFIDPITGETSEFEVCGIINQDQKRYLEKCGIDAQAHIQFAIEKEVKHAQETKYYDSIKNYAERNNFECIGIADPYNLPKDVLKPVYETVSKSKRPQMILSASTANMLEEQVLSRLPNTYHNQDIMMTDTISPLMTVEIPVGEDKKIVEVCINPYLPWDNHTCLVFDADNPKNCKLVEFNFEM